MNVKLTISGSRRRRRRHYQLSRSDGPLHGPRLVRVLQLEKSSSEVRRLISISVCHSNRSNLIYSEKFKLNNFFRVKWNINLLSTAEKYIYKKHCSKKNTFDFLEIFRKSKSVFFCRLSLHAQ